MGKNSKREALREEQLKRRATLEQRRELYNGIADNLSSLNGNARKPVDTAKNLFGLSQARKRAQEPALQNKKVDAIADIGNVQNQDFDFVNLVYEFNEFAQATEDVEISSFTETPCIDKSKPIDVPLEDKPQESSIPEEKPDEAMLEPQSEALPTVERENLSESEDALAVISNFAEKRFKLSDGREAQGQLHTELPIMEKHFEIVEILRNIDVMVLRAPTGTGKSTMLPQILMSEGYAHDLPAFGKKILCTEPRRIAAIGVAKRVSDDWGVAGQISHAVRDSSNESAATRVLYATEGVLLEMLKHDALLRDFSVVILDEAHERSQQMDVSIPLIARIVAQRREQFENTAKTVSDEAIYTSPDFDKQFPIQPLKLIIMSATLQFDQFQHIGRYLNVSLDSRAFPVAVHYEKQPCDDLLETVAEKAVEIHQNYPPGSVLIFVTGAREVEKVCDAIHQRLGASEPLKTEEFESTDDEGFELADSRKEYTPQPLVMDEQYTEDELLSFEHDDMKEVDTNEISTLKEEIEEAIKGDIEKKIDDNAPERQHPPNFEVLPLYSSLPLFQQNRIYAPIDKNQTRVFIVATNIAESSITVPGVRYVVDCCMQKVRIEEEDAQQLVEQYTGMSNLIQRAGRAGRTSPGHCFRLLTPGEFGALAPNLPPELTRLDLNQIILYLLFVGINPLRFHWPEDFDESVLRKYLDELFLLGAVQKSDGVPKLTKFGYDVAEIPLDVHAAAICAFGKSYTSIAIAASLHTECFRDLILNDDGGDFLSVAKMLIDFMKLKRDDKWEFCLKYQLNYDKLYDAERVFNQVCNILKYPRKLTDIDSSDRVFASSAVLYAFLSRYAILENSKKGSYKIANIDLSEHYTGGDEQIKQLIKENPSVQLNIIPQNDKMLVSSIIHFAQEFRPQELAHLAEVSEVLTHSLPKSVFLDKHGKMRCKVDVFLDQIEVGETEVSYPGRTARETLNIEKLVREAKIMLLARGDYGNKLNCCFEVIEEFSKGVFNSKKLEAAAELLKGEEAQFWKNAELVERIEDTLV